MPAAAARWFDTRRDVKVVGVTEHSHVNAVAEEIASTANGRRDGDILVSALNDPESRAAGRAYLASLAGARAARA